MVCFHWFHFLKVTWEVKSYHSNFSSHVYPDWPVSSIDVGGGCYRVVSEHGSLLRLDEQCAFHALMLVAYVLLMLVVYVHVSFAWF